MIQPISKSAAITLTLMDDAHVDAPQLALKDLKGLLTSFGYGAELKTVIANLPAVVNAGVQGARQGVIQDPAGSAVGSGHFPSGGGGSGAIYKHFHDLDPIPNIKEMEAVFNSSTADGGRVLHTYSPHLLGLPSVAKDCTKAVQDLAVGYFNSFRAEKMVDGTPPTVLPLTPFNAVPISGRIFANSFASPKPQYAFYHLHPTYTYAGIMVALAEMVRAGETLPVVKIYYFDKPVFAMGSILEASLKA